MGDGAAKISRREVRMAPESTTEPLLSGSGHESPIHSPLRQARRSTHGSSRRGEACRDDPWTVKEVLAEVRKNIFAGVTVALVNMPLSISLGVAAGATPTMGCLAAIWAGMTSACLGGSKFNMVGPAGALSGILAQASVNWGDPSILPILSITSGLVCLVVFALKIDQYAQFVPASVMEGFTIGVACTVALNQLNFALGLGQLAPHPKFLDNVVENLMHVTDAKWQAVAMFLAFFLGQLILHVSFSRVPWPVVLVALGMMIGYLHSEEGGHVIDFGGDFQLQTLQTRYSNLTMPLFEFPTLDTSRFELSVVQNLFSTSCSLSMVIIIETLISARIADQMTKTHFNQRQEVLAISLANIVSGVFGGIPAAASLARTALSIRSGATSRMAPIICTLVTAALAALFMPLFRFLPLPVVASILVNVSYGMLDAKEIFHIYDLDRQQFLLMLFVAFLVVFVDTTVGILIGTIVSMLNFVGQVSAGHCACTLWHGEKMIVEFEADQVIRDHAMPMLFQRRRMISESGPDPSLDSALESRIFCNTASGMGGSPSEMEAFMTREQLIQMELDQALEEGVSEQDARPHEEGYDLVLEYKIDGKLNFVTAETHSKRLRAIGEPSITLLINLSHVTSLDVDGIFILQVLLEELASQQRSILICGVTNRTKHILKKAQFYTDMKAKGLVIKNYMSNLHRFIGRLPNAWMEDNNALMEELTELTSKAQIARTRSEI